jgi:DNA-binding NarL/FixJ family response regulator
MQDLCGTGFALPPCIGFLRVLEDLRRIEYNDRGVLLSGRETVGNESSGPILVVDDDRDFRAYLASLFENLGYRTEQAATGAEVLPTALADRPAAVVLDVELPDVNGYEVCRELRDHYGDEIPIVLVSGERIEALDRSAGLLLGADDYLTKPVDGGELIARIRRLVERNDGNRQVPVLNGKLSLLTKREHEVLELLAEGYQQDDIARRLVISPKTVATHIQRILAKLDVRSRAQAVALALRDDGRDVVGHAAG